MNWVRKFLMTCLLVAIFFLGYEYREFRYLQGKNEIIENNSDFDFNLFYDVWDLMQKKYVDPEIFSEKEPFEYGMIKGLVYGLEDPFSSFMTPDEKKEFYDSLQGNFEGIGAELTMKHNAVTVVTPLKGSPAKKAGLMPHDIILKVNDEDITDVDLLEVVKRIRGEKGTEVVLNVYRQSSGETLDITITRDVINVPSVTSEMKENIAYIEISQFGDDTKNLFESQFKQLLENDPQGIILDLRYNGGGYFEDTIEIASAFLKENVPVVEVKSRNAAQVYNSKYKSFASTTLPLVVLINGGSASSAEILAGALKDNKRAVLIGEKSFGKGTVQEVVSLTGGGSLRVTIAEWLTPNGFKINKEGIIPNIKIEKTREDMEAENTPQLDLALEIVKDPNWLDFMEKENFSFLEKNDSDLVDNFTEDIKIEK